MNDNRKHLEAIATLDTQAREYERITQRRILSGAGPDDVLVIGSSQVAEELRHSIEILQADLAGEEPTS